MSADVGLGIVTLLCAIVLFGRAASFRYRRGEPMVRWAVVWFAILAVAFLVATLVDRR